ncbi:MAG: Methionyl-tRNA formyltransferase [Parcubacteria group bacterium GW2011_GWC1_43_12]|nr:MAG: Methionyl-tRNA formyltransferase [Parcubacteria group bacterium GW2011_GWB1_42_6]KKS91912.1 MAG: Methionyl-tRNA formyltransferase [Parcubacteria group bacterium GW2011_GWC1_43_12]
MSNLPTKILFLGASRFALPILETLAKSDFKPAAVLTAPDKSSGRGLKPSESLIKKEAESLGIPVFQPNSLAEIEKTAKEINPDLLVLAAYGKILPQNILDLPKFGCLNVHPSLLPKYRGASPIQYSILNGDKEAGVTVMKMASKVDAGPILAQEKFILDRLDYTAPELAEILSGIGADLLLKVIPFWINGKIKLQEQDDSKATFAKILKKEDGLIDWNDSAAQIERKIRAFVPWPGTFSRLEGKIIKIISAKAIDEDTANKTGEIYLNDKENLCIKTRKGSLIIKTLQPQNGKAMDAQSYLRGNKQAIGKILE